MMLALWDGLKKVRAKGGIGKKKGMKGKIGKKKGPRQKRGKKVAKGGKKKKAKPKLPIIEERPPTPPTTAYLHKYSFENEKDFFDFMIDCKIDKPTYVLFCFKEADYDRNIFDEEEVYEVDENEGEEDTEVLEVEEWMEFCLRGMEKHHLSKDIAFMVVNITPKEFQECHAYHHPATKIRILPTFMRWGSTMRLEGEECLSEDDLYLFFSREIQRNGQRYVDDGSVNPFYTPPPPEPTPPPTPKPKKKKVKKGKVGKKGKGKKGTGKKVKGKMATGKKTMGKKGAGIKGKGTKGTGNKGKKK